MGLFFIETANVMKKYSFIIAFIFLHPEVGLFAQSPKAKFRTVALVNATVETITKGRIENGTVLLKDGKIVAAGTNINIPSDAETIDCRGLTVYPGMIDSGTHIGLTEIGSDQRTQDFNEIGEVTPQMRAKTAVNPNSTLIPVTRVSGVTTVLTTPSGGLFSGSAALLNLHGYTPDQMFAGFEAVQLNFPNTGRQGRYDKRTDEEIKKAAEKSLKELNDAWEKAVQYHTLDSATRGSGIKYYPEMQSLLPVVRGTQPLLVEVNAAADIQAALTWIKERRIKRVILTGVAEGWRLADKIAEAGIPVIAGPVLSLPAREYDRYDKPYANPGLMKRAGVTVAIRSMESANSRNLPYHAGFAAAYGMGREEALKAITIVAAEIFGVADRLGSIEPGKNATLFVCDGDPFEPKTKVKYVFIDGWEIPMVSRQTEFYEEFLQREPALKKN